jgi:hypothetical protein
MVCEKRTAQIRRGKPPVFRVKREAIPDIPRFVTHLNSWLRIFLVAPPRDRSAKPRLFPKQFGLLDKRERSKKKALKLLEAGVPIYLAHRLSDYSQKISFNSTLIKNIVPEIHVVS